MLFTVQDLVEVMETIEVIKTSTLLTDAQRKIMLDELKKDIPAPVFCKKCPETLSIINSLVETRDAKAKPTPKKGRKSTKGNSLLLKVG